MLGAVWFFLWEILWAVYFMLDGFDLGTGALLPFMAKNDTERMIIYQTECMARYHRIKSTQVSIGFIESHKGQYWQHGDNNFIPDGPIAFTGGIDSQDKGFYYTVIGWGYMMKWWLIRHDYIHCPIDESEFLDRSTVYAKLHAGIFAEPYRRKDGNAIEIRQWFIDRGGHRPEDVDYIVEHMPEVEAYIGMTQLNPKLPLVNKSDRGPFYLGQTESLSLYTLSP